MSSIILREWDFGDGSEKSTLRSPYHIFKRPGIFPITLKVTHSDGRVKVSSKSNYIRVYSVAECVYDIGNLSSKKCLVFGTNGQFGNGWSEFSGEEWIWPESRASMTDIAISGDVHKVCFDNKTGLPFILNPRDGDAGSGIEASFVDKKNEPLYDENGDVTGIINEGYPVEWLMITPEYVGSENKFRVSHEETFVKIRPITKEDSFDPDLELTAYLLHDGSPTAHRTVRAFDEQGEIMFPMHDRANEVQVGIKGSHGGIRITDIETSLLRSDVTRVASRPESGDAQFQLYMATMSIWLTRTDASINSATGIPIDPAVTFNLQDGPDGLSNSAFEITQQMVLTLSGETFLCFFYEGASINLLDEGDVSIPLTETEFGSWKFAYADITGKSEVKFPINSILFDVRIIQQTLTDLTWLSDYTTDVVVNSGNKYLPYF